MKIGILGAGRSGRGFLARLLQGQAEIAFFDRDAALISRLNEQSAFTVRFFDGAPEKVIEGYEAYHLSDARCCGVLSGCDLLMTSVRGENGRDAGKWILENAPALPVVACENAVMPAGTLGEPLSQTAGSGAIFCTTVEDGPLDILSEGYPALHVSACAAAEPFRALKGFIFEDDFSTLMARKIYTYNAASGIIAYLGAERGIESYAEAANDPAIERALDEFYREINGAICAEFGVDPAAQAEFAGFSRKKFQNRAIRDSVQRNAASPLRKLGADERIIAPARLIRKHGGGAQPLVRTAAAALHYLGAAQERIGEILTGPCGLSPDERLYQDILSAFREANLMRERAFE